MSEYIFKLPDLAEGTVESEIGEWFIKVGDLVKEETVVGTMMTDKAAVEVSSPVTGTVIKLAGEPGDIVAVGAPLVVFDLSGDAPAEEVAAKAPTTKDEVAAEAPPTEAKAPPTRVMTSPAIRRRAKEAGVDLALVPGTGPGGRIVRKDFDAYLKARATGVAIATPQTPSTKVKETKIIGVRRVIAERMQAAKQEIPHFSYVEELDVTELESLRQHLNSKKDQADRLTIQGPQPAAATRSCAPWRRDTDSGRPEGPGRQACRDDVPRRTVGRDQAPVGSRANEQGNEE